MTKVISFRQKGDFSNSTNYLKRVRQSIKMRNLDKYGEQGVEALMSTTPVDSGLTANSWYYKISYEKDSVTISFHNSNIQNGVPIAIILQYGHTTGNGGWVEGRDYINPAIRPIFESITNNAWEEVTK